MPNASIKKIIPCKKIDLINMILDIEGQSYFTDRMVSLLLLNTTILRRERKGVDFLSPFYQNLVD